MTAISRFLSDRATGGVRETGACVKCQGRCCRHAPGGFYPDDFIEPLAESLEECFASGFVAVDWWEGYDYESGDPRGLFVRPSLRDTAGLKIEHGPWGGICALLSDNGCVLPYELRPRGCRMLVPLDGGGCGAKTEGGADGYEAKKHCADAWLPYRTVILKAMARAEGRLQTPELPECSLDRVEDGGGLEAAFASMASILSGEEWYGHS